MGVYIRNMEMPNKKNGAVLIIYPDSKCAFEDGKIYQAIPVPAHGRLIDADDVYHVLTSYYHHRTDFQHEALKEALARVSTIIPAEEGE